mmetsp:Transcript_3313/g.6101  ORF Transcript_3313/g.6101 Transcript_3313/m.6101 type:complete len:118 (+) Transcript_3313:348-701(+)
MHASRRESFKTDDRNEQHVTRTRNSKDDLGDSQESSLSKGGSNKTSFKQQSFTEKKNPRIVSANALYHLVARYRNPRSKHFGAYLFPRPQKQNQICSHSWTCTWIPWTVRQKRPFSA